MFGAKTSPVQLWRTQTASALDLCKKWMRQMDSTRICLLRVVCDLRLQFDVVGLTVLFAARFGGIKVS